MNLIKKFNQIQIIPGSLVVFDIDDTLIKFDGIDLKWWKNKVKKYMVMTRNEQLAEIMANNDLMKIMEKCEPELVDENIYDFINLLSNSGCKIILLTARDELSKELTIKHLKSVKLEFDEIYFNQNKGDELLNIYNSKYSNIKDIIVIDDIEKNLQDIENKLSCENINLHLYNIKN